MLYFCGFTYSSYPVIFYINVTLIADKAAATRVICKVLIIAYIASGSRRIQLEDNRDHGNIVMLLLDYVWFTNLSLAVYHIFQGFTLALTLSRNYSQEVPQNLRIFPPVLWA